MYLYINFICTNNRICTLLCGNSSNEINDLSYPVPGNAITLHYKQCTKKRVPRKH